MTEAPAGLNQTLPGGVVNESRDRKTARTLKRLDERSRAVTEGLLRVVGREISEGGESLVQFTYARTRVTELERVEVRQTGLQVRGDLLEHGALGLGAHESRHDLAVLE
jgi:hypothetical protein